MKGSSPYLTQIHRFFSNMPPIKGPKLLSKKPFKCDEKTQGLLTKLELKDYKETIEEVFLNFKEALQPNALHFFTTPTQRTKGAFSDFVYPGHNASFITNERCEIVACMSKRQGKKTLGTYLRIPDPRFPTAIKNIYSYDALFTTIPQELKNWYCRAIRVEKFPLFIQSLPKDVVFLKFYQKNVAIMREINEPYSLFSTVISEERWRAASNCNAATEASIKGFDYCSSTHDEFCQLAVKEIISKEIEDPTDYLKIYKDFQLYTDGEESSISLDNYRSAFLL